MSDATNVFVTDYDYNEAINSCFRSAVKCCNYHYLFSFLEACKVIGACPGGLVVDKKPIISFISHELVANWEDTIQFKHDGIKVYNSENTNLQELTDNEDFINPKRSRTLKLTKVQESDIIQRPMRPITIENRFRNLAFPNNEPRSTNFDDDDLTPSSNVDTTQSRKVKNNVKTLYNDNQSASFIPVKPGKETFSSTVINGRKISIFSDSILKGIRAQEFNDNIESGKASFKRFSGATSKQLNHYTLPTLIEESPNTVVIHVGTNDLKQKDKTKENIAKEIMNIGITSRKHGAKNIVISSIVTRRGVNLDRKRKEANMLLKDMCVKEGFYYLDNDNVTFDKLYKDGVHLVENGSIVLANNILNFLNSLY